MIRLGWIALLSASISGSIATAVLMLVCGLLRFFKKEQPLLFAGCLALALYLFPFALLFPQKGLPLPPVDPNLSSGVLPFVEPFPPALTESSPAARAKRTPCPAKKFLYTKFPCPALRLLTGFFTRQFTCLMATSFQKVICSLCCATNPRTFGRSIFGSKQPPSLQPCCIGSARLSG